MGLGRTKLDPDSDQPIESQEDPKRKDWSQQMTRPMIPQRRSPSPQTVDALAAGAPRLRSYRDQKFNSSGKIHDLRNAWLQIQGRVGIYDPSSPRADDPRDHLNGEGIA